MPFPADPSPTDPDKAHLATRSIRVGEGEWQTFQELPRVDGAKTAGAELRLYVRKRIRAAQDGEERAA